MKIVIIGTGYVGLVSGACFAELGLDVTCVDVDVAKIDGLNSGIVHIYEPNLDSLVARNVQSGRLHFTTDLLTCIDGAEVVFIAVGTPPDEDGSADLKYVLEVAHQIGANIGHYVLVVNKSTVPVGTAEKVKSAIQQELSERGVDLEFDVASNPEFLKEGDAIDDFMKPDRVVIGVDSVRAKDIMTRLYRPMQLNSFRVIFMDIPSAEMTKYAANAMLATRISFMNDIANLCEMVGANVTMVRRGIGSDSRIGNKFLYAGCGYGGSCFPKDIKALIKTAHAHDYHMELLESVEAVNSRQKNVLFDKFFRRFSGDIAGKKAAIWGLSFKPGTDDMREATSLVLIKSLLTSGCSVKVYDPVAMPEAQLRLGDRVSYATDMYDAVLDADILFHVTEWKEFRMPNWEIVKRSMAHPIVIDGRNVYSHSEMHSVEYINIGNAKA